jgi:ubiquinone/menaquinone biosynthesis C-methylase UbiE
MKRETIMEVTQRTNDEQTTLWNGRAGRAWVEAQELLDRIFKPFEDLLVQAVSAGTSVSRVLDVGCGAGSTTLAVARLLGGKGQCIGIDISDPMIATARARAEREGTPPSFIYGNAQMHTFEPASFDMVISRFGVMFFDDFVGAFENLRRAARKGAEMQFIAWRSPSENPFMTTAERAAAPLLPNLPSRRPDAPGQFALADQNRIYSILEESGWAEVSIQPIDIACTFPENELVRYFTKLGPLGLILHEADDLTRMKVIETLRAAFDPYVCGAEVRFTAACWMVSARAV